MTGIYQKICLYCDKKFTPKSNKAKYCCAKCRFKSFCVLNPRLKDPKN